MSMPHAENELPPDLLLRHAGFVRGLARALLGDPHLADDVAQEAWIAAHERPPRDAAAAGGWLAVVAERLALRRRRAEGRRRRREHAVARPEASVDGTADALARESVLRQVTDAVLALEEPYRRTVLARFYEESSVRAIAENEGVPEPTVRARLRRGLERLRARLDRASGGDRERWQLGMLAAVGAERAVKLVPAAAVAVGGAGSLALATKLALAGGGALGLVLAAVFVRGRLADPPAAAGPDARESALVDAATRPELAEPTADGDARAAVATSATRADAQAGAAGALRVVSTLGLVLPWVDVRAGDEPWTRIELAAGGVVVAETPFDELRAPGHATVRVEEAVGELALEPVLALVVRAPDLADVVRDVQILPAAWGVDLDRQVREAVLGSFLADGTYAVAVDPTAFHVSLFELEFIGPASFWWRLKPDLAQRGVFTVELDTAAAPRDVVDVRIELVGHEGCERASVQVDRLGDGTFVSREHVWGTLSQHFYEGPACERVAGGFVVPVLEIGALHRAYAVCRAHALWGRADFTARPGETVRVPVRRGKELRGRLGVADGSEPPSAFVLEVEGSDTPGRRGSLSFWRSEIPLEPDRAGRFRTSLPYDLPRYRGAVPELPRWFWMKVRASGFEPLISWIDLGETAGDALDLGELVLTPAVAHVRIAPGHGFDENAPRADVHVPRTVDGVLRFEGASTRLRADGSIELALKRTDAPDAAAVRALAERGGRSEQVDARWSSAEHPAIVVSLSDGEGAALELGADGAYRPVVTRTLAFEALCRRGALGKGNLMVGWTWRGIDYAAEYVAAFQVGTPFVVTLAVPRDVAGLWIGTDAPERRYPVPADGARLVFP